MKSFCLWLSLLLFSVQFFSCSGCETQAPRLRSPERKIVDSLYKQKVEILQVELDSICNESFDARVDYAVDSIMQIRIKERKEKLGY